MTVLTPSQTVGPYFRIGLDWPHAWRLVDDTTPGERLTLTGRLLDGDGAPVPDALIEIWQADAAGHYARDAGAAFRGAGRCAVDADGCFRFETIRPGRVAAPDGTLQAPHINLLVMARGLLRHVYTRVYFAADTALHAADAVLACVPAARRATLVARADGALHSFDIHLQGARETVFFDL